MNSTQLLVSIKNVYGNEVIYPECPKSELIARMLRQKTLTRRDIDYLQSETLGYTINVKQLELKL
jgi:hypothetical protein